MVRKSLIFGLVVALVIGIGLGFAVFTAEEEVPQIPGITAEDTWPNGCVNCHKGVGDPAEPQTKLSIKLKEWAKGAPAELVELLQKAAPEGVTLTGRHPEVDVSTAEIPSTCYACHALDKETGKARYPSAPLFPRGLHLVHFNGREKSEFVTEFGGWCTACHKLDFDTGEWTMKQGKEGE